MDPVTRLPLSGDDRSEVVTGEAAGVPFLAVPPAGGRRPSAPVVLAWHLLDPPRTEAAFAAALPLAELDAWRVYLGLPLCGTRLPAGGFEELAQRGLTDAVRDLHQPVIEGAAEEFPAALATVRAQLGIDGEVAGLMGGSVGAAVAQLILAEGLSDAGTVVLVSPVVQLRTSVDATARAYGMTYPWSAASEAVAARLDFVARAGEVAARGATAVLLVVGEDDDPAYGDQALALRAALRRRGGTAEVATVAGMGHALGEDPGLRPAPQSPCAAAVDRLAREWFSGHLPLS